MPNPAPIISNIGAFDKNQGTTIYYNVIGATEIIRSSKIEIYSVSDNSLKLSYTYTGVMQSGGQYQIILPSAETSGALSNNVQYYARIQTYTSTTGEQGASGWSVAKIFWCISEPTLTPPTIVGNVTTSTYDAIFTYTYNGDVINKIKQYEIVLLEGGIVRETSGVIVNAGTEISTKTYQVHYNLSGLQSGATYTIRCTVLTTEGMTKTSTTQPFLCRISAPSFSAANVVNNPCNGYITISSNITNIEGVYYGEGEVPYLLTHGVDLTQGGYVEWATGLTIASTGDINNWTAHMWCYDISPIESFVKDLALVYFGVESRDGNVGKIGAFVTENDSHTKIRIELLVDIDGTEGNIGTYHSPYINTPSTNDRLYVRVRCINNWFEVDLINLDDE